MAFGQAQSELAPEFLQASRANAASPLCRTPAGCGLGAARPEGRSVTRGAGA